MTEWDSLDPVRPAKPEPQIQPGRDWHITAAALGIFLLIVATLVCCYDTIMLGFIPWR